MFIIPNITTEKIITRFAPVNNRHGYDVRLIQIVKNKTGKQGEIKTEWMHLKDYDISDMSTLRPKKHCSSNQDYIKQILKLFFGDRYSP